MTLRGEKSFDRMWPGYAISGSIYSSLISGVAWIWEESVVLTAPHFFRK